ncbi:MAG: ankyrin repeat domain-containing protein [Pseudomonadota bacterium]
MKLNLDQFQNLLSVIASNNAAELDLLLQQEDVKSVINDIDEIGQTPLIKAAKNGNVEIVGILLKHGADVNYADRENGGGTALMAAACEGHVNIVKALLDKGAEVNNQKDGGWTALMEAAAYADSETIKALLDGGAHINQADNDNCIALTYAVQNSVANVRILLNSGAEVNHLDKFGYTALTSAAKFSRDPEIINEIITNTYKKKGNDWSIMIYGNENQPSQLTEEVLNILPKESVILLATVIDKEELRNSIVANYNKKNPQDTIDPNSIGLLRILRSRHHEFFMKSGVAASEANFMANEKLLSLVNNPEEREVAFDRHSKISKMVQDPNLLTYLKFIQESEKNEKENETFNNLISRLAPKNHSIEENKIYIAILSTLTPQEVEILASGHISAQNNSSNIRKGVKPYFTDPSSIISNPMISIGSRNNYFSI